MLPETNLVVTAIILTLTMVALVSFYILLLVTTQNRKLRFDAEKKDLQQATLMEVAKAEKEATQTALSEIGRELHDNVGQLLAATQIGLMYHFKDELESSTAMQKIVSTLETSIDELSRLGRALNSDFWKERDLFAAIVEEAARLEHLGNFIIPVEQHGDEDGLNHNERVIVYRAFQEIVQNALKHSKAGVIRISLRASPFYLSIADDGKGFDMSIGSKGTGIKNIRHRCDMINMIASVESQPGKGTTWEIKRIKKATQ